MGTCGSCTAGRSCCIRKFAAGRGCIVDRRGGTRPLKALFLGPPPSDGLHVPEIKLKLLRGLLETILVGMYQARDRHPRDAKTCMSCSTHVHIDMYV